MADTTSTAATTAAVHPAWYARAGTWFLKVGQSVKGVIQKIAGEMPAVNAELQKIAPTVEGVSELLVKGSATFEQHLLDVWGAAASTVEAAGDAATANGVSVSLDAALVADIKNFLPQVKAYLHPQASSAAPPKGS